MVLLIDMFQIKKGNIDIQSEDCSINFPENYLAHLSLTKSFWSSYEEPYSHVKTSSYSEKDKMTYLPVFWKVLKDITS